MDFDGSITVIPAPGVWTLTQDIVWSGTTGAALTVACDNVTIDLNGHNIIGSGDVGSTAVGISGTGVSGLTITGGSISGFMYGISVDSSYLNSNNDNSYLNSNNVVSNVNVSDCTFRAISLCGTGDVVTGCNVSNIGGTTVYEPHRAFGIEFHGPGGQAINDTVTDVHGTSESVGISFSDQGFGSLVSGCLIDGTGSTGGTYGVWVSSPASVDLVGDQISNWQTGAAFSAYSTGTYTNSTFANDANPIIGNATDLGGNTIPPVVAVSDLTAMPDQVLAASSLFTATVSNGATITTYAFEDNGAGGGQFLLDGVAQPAGQEIDVTADQLSHLAYRAGSGGDTLQVRVNDGTQWSTWSQTFTVSAPVDTGPTVAVSDLTATHDQSFAASSLFTASDPLGDAITMYDFWNTGDGGGQFLLNGQALAAGQDNFVSAAQLGQLTYQSGAGTDTMWVRVSDGPQWSDWSAGLTINATTTVGAGQAVELASGYSGTITFTATTGTLILDSSSSFSGAVAGLSGQDALDLRDITAGANAIVAFSGNSTGGTLTVGDGTHTASIALLGNYLASSFVASSDGHGGTSIVDPPALDQPAQVAAHHT